MVIVDTNLKGLKLEVIYIVVRKCELNLLLEKNKNLDDANQKLQNQLALLECQKQEIEKLVKRESQKKVILTFVY